jgi:hypothetical protein
MFKYKNMPVRIFGYLSARDDRRGFSRSFSARAPGPLGARDSSGELTADGPRRRAGPLDVDMCVFAGGALVAAGPSPATL